MTDELQIINQSNQIFAIVYKKLVPLSGKTVTILWSKGPHLKEGYYYIYWYFIS